MKAKASKKRKSPVKKKKANATGTTHTKARARKSPLFRDVPYYSVAVLVILVGIIYTFSNESRNAKPKDQVGTPTVNLHGEAKPLSDNSGLLADEFQAIQALSFQERVDYWSSFIETSLEGRRKLVSSLSSQQTEDSAPIIPDEYNCTTYVETVAALARSKTPDEIVSNLLAIRYRGGQPSFENRNHFPEADWIPNNVKANILIDITADLARKAGVSLRTESKTIDRGKWLSEQVRHDAVSRKLASVVSKEWSAPTSVSINYIPLEDVKKVIDQFPTGAVVNLVHKDDRIHPVLITHQGFVIREGKQVSLRHASTGGEIRTSDLYAYLLHLSSRQGKTARWPLIGVNINQINDSTSANSRLSDSQ